MKNDKSLLIGQDNWNRTIMCFCDKAREEHCEYSGQDIKTFEATNEEYLQFLKDTKEEEERIKQKSKNILKCVGLFIFSYFNGFCFSKPITDKEKIECVKSVYTNKLNKTISKQLPIFSELYKNTHKNKQDIYGKIATSIFEGNTKDIKHLEQRLNTIEMIQRVVEKTIEFEGLSLKAYNDLNKKAIGGGNNLLKTKEFSKCNINNSISKTFAIESVYVHIINDYVLLLNNNSTLNFRKLPVEKQEAILLLAYNIGVNKILDSVNLKMILNGYGWCETRTEGFMHFTTAKGKFLEGLIKRRAYDINLFNGIFNNKNECGEVKVYKEEKTLTKTKRMGFFKKKTFLVKETYLIIDQKNKSGKNFYKEINTKDLGNYKQMSK